MHLREPTLFLELAENVAGVGSWWVDLVTGTVNWSKQVYVIHGVTPEEHTPDLESGINFYHPEDRPLVEQYVNNAIQNKEPFDFELRLQRRDGSIRWVHSKGECRLNDAGEVIAIYGVFQDMTERRNTEEKLRISEERYQLAVSGASVGLWDWDVSTNALYWSPRFMEIVGIDNTSFVPELSEFEDRLHPEDHDRIMQALQDHLERNEPYDVEYRLLKEDGRYVWIHAKGQAIWDENGAPLRMAGSVSDIQNRKFVEKRFELAVSAANSGIWDWTDINSDDEWWSPRFFELLGYENEEIEASLTRFSDLLHPDDRPETFALVEKVFAGEANFDIEYRLKTKYMGYRWFQGFGKVQFDNEGKPKRMVGSITDIHSRKKTEHALQQYTQDLKRSNDELDSFAYVASHDLKAPLRAIVNLASWIEEDAGDVLPPESAEHLKHLKQRIARMDGLLNDLLNYSRVSRSESDTEAIDISQLIGDIIDLLHPPETFQFDIPHDLPILKTARAPIQQVFLNLIGNAIKHHHQPCGLIKIEWVDLGSHFSFAVRDNGPGIAPEYHERVFQLFQTLKPRDEVEGSGMGLSLVQKLVLHHGGTITLDSQPGEGATFTFTWPKVAPSKEMQ